MSNELTSHKVRIHGATYHLKSVKPPAYLDRVARIVDSGMDAVARNAKNVSSTLLAVHAAMNITDDLLVEEERREAAENRLGAIIDRMKTELGSVAAESEAEV